jgi:hypothetical protein
MLSRPATGTTRISVTTGVPPVVAERVKGAILPILSFPKAVVRPARTLAQKQFVRCILLAQPSPAVNP